MPLWLQFLVLAMATYNVAYALIKEDGFTVKGQPVLLFFRSWVGVKFNEFSEPYGETNLSILFTCIKCFSRWAALCMLIPYYFYGEIIAWIYLPLAVSTFVMVLYDKSENSN